MNRYVKVIMVVSMFALAGCGVNVKSATNALEAQGITNVKILGYSFFGCSEDDTFRSNFTGIGSNGKPISGTVCQGVWKGTTIRYD